MGAGAAGQGSLVALPGPHREGPATAAIVEGAQLARPGRPVSTARLGWRPGEPAAGGHLAWGAVMTSPDGGWAPAASRGPAGLASRTDAAAAGPEEGRAGSPIGRERGRAPGCGPRWGAGAPGARPLSQQQARVRGAGGGTEHQVWVRSPLCAAPDLGPRPLGAGKGRETRPISIPSAPDVCKAPTVWRCWGLRRPRLAEGDTGHAPTECLTAFTPGRRRTRTVARSRAAQPPGHRAPEAAGRPGECEQHETDPG